MSNPTVENNQIFNSCDMVVTYTEDLINDQFQALQSPLMAVIPNTLAILQEVGANNNFVYTVYDNNADSDFKQKKENNAYISGTYVPEVKIRESQSNIPETIFTLTFSSGTAKFWEGRGRLGQWQEFPMDGWAFTFQVNLKLAELAAADIANHQAIPQLVKEQLTAFTTDDFTINHLLLDLESADLDNFLLDESNAGQAGQTGLQDLQDFMKYYIGNLKNSEHPYILGYSVNSTEKTKYNEATQIPSSLKPTSTTYSLFYDANQPPINNLNFLLATEAGQKVMKTEPPPFAANWFTPHDQVNAKMIISHADLIEPLFLIPLFNNLKTKVWNKIYDSFSKLNSGKDYSAGKQPTSTGITYTISNQDIPYSYECEQKYNNTYQVTFDNSQPAQTTINIEGRLELYRKETKDIVGPFNPEAHSGSTIYWNANITISATKDENSKPILKVTQSTSIDQARSTHDQGMNGAAEFFKDVADILGFIFDLFTFFQDNNFFTNLFEDLLTVQIPDLGAPETAITNITNVVKDSVMLPAGNEFFFKNPVIDNQGNFYLDLTYKN